MGFPRSGTTLLERILDAHPDIFGLGERSVMAAYAPIAQEKLYSANVSFMHWINQMTREHIERIAQLFRVADTTSTPTKHHTNKETTDDPTT